MGGDINSKDGTSNDEDDELVIESINASSANTNKVAILESDAQLQFIQETCLTKALQATFDKEAKEYKKSAIGSPLDPEHIKATAGVAAVAQKPLHMYPIPNPTDDYKDAEKTGRCKICCIDIGGQTLACANVYGWSGGTGGSKEAERTDDILAIIRMQFKAMDPGPKLICGDLNAQRGCLPNLETMIKEEGWTDVGGDHTATRGKPNQFTCHANAGAKQSRIDFFITNEHLTPAVKSFEIIQDANFPTHRPIRIKVATTKLTTTTNQLRKPTNFAKLFQDKVDEEVKAKQGEADKEATEENQEPKKTAKIRMKDGFGNGAENV